MTAADPEPGDGSLASGGSGRESQEPAPGHPTPTRDGMAGMDPADSVDAASYPVIHDLAAGLAYDYYAEEFEAALDNMLDRIERYVGET